jgi:hypothetical protein
MPYLLKTVVIWVGIYFIALLFSFVSKVTYKKRSINDVRQDWKSIVIQTSIMFAVFMVASILWGVWGLKGE